MIEIISQPDNWSGAYDSILYKFRKLVSVGSFDVTDNYTYNKRVFQAGVAVNLFPVGSYVKIIISGVTSYVKVLAHDGTDVVIDLPTAFTSVPTNPVWSIPVTPLKISLSIGKLANGIAMETFCTIRAISKDGQFSVELAGYIQDYFRNIQKPPVEGFDPDLYCNFRLLADDGSGQIIGDLNNVVYSAYPNINASTFVSAYLPVRPNSSIETFTGKSSIYSRIMATFVKTYLT